MKFDHFFWDYDGTLFDTYDALTRAYLRAAKEIGIGIGYDEMRWMAKHSVGWAAQQLGERAGMPAAEVQDIYYRYALEEETMETMKPYPGTAQVLEAICRKGGMNYLYSHRDRRSIEALTHYGLKGYFTDFITKEHQFPRKPEPDALLYLVRKHALDPARCIMVGDRVLDVEAGLNAGMSGALFDPDDFCKGQAPTPYQYPSMDALRLALVEEDTAPAAE